MIGTAFDFDRHPSEWDDLELRNYLYVWDSNDTDEEIAEMEREAMISTVMIVSEQLEPSYWEGYADESYGAMFENEEGDD